MMECQAPPVPCAQDLGYGIEESFKGGCTKPNKRGSTRMTMCIYNHDDDSSCNPFDDSSVSYSDSEDEDDFHTSFASGSLMSLSSKRHMSLSSKRSMPSRVCTVEYDEEEERNSLMPTRVDVEYGSNHSASTANDASQPRRITMQFSQSNHSRKGCLDVSLGTSRLPRHSSNMVPTQRVVRNSSARSSARRITMDHTCSTETPVNHQQQQRPAAKRFTMNTSSRPSRRTTLEHRRTPTTTTSSSSRRTPTTTLSSSSRRTTMDLSSRSSAKRNTMDLKAMSLSVRRMDLKASNPRRISMDVSKLSRSNPTAMRNNLPQPSLSGRAA